MESGVPVWAAAISAIGSVAVLRYAWSRSMRSARLNSIGWLLLALSATAGGAAGGAWGIAIASLFAMGTALLLLAKAALSSPAKEGKTSNRKAGMLPGPGEPRRIWGRIATFLIVVAGGFIASLAFAIGLRGLALSIGWSEAGANALALFLVPMIWGIVAFWLLMQDTRLRQATTLAGFGIFILAAFATGT